MIKFANLWVWDKKQVLFETLDTPTILYDSIAVYPNKHGNCNIIRN